MEGMCTIYRQCLGYLYLQGTVIAKILNGNNCKLANFIPNSIFKLNARL